MGNIFQDLDLLLPTTAVEHFRSVYVASTYINGLVDGPKATASEFFFRQIDRLLSGRMLCSEQRRRLLAFHAQLAQRRGRVPAFFEVGVAVRLVFGQTLCADFRPANIEFQAVHFNLDVTVFLEKDPGEMIPRRDGFAPVVDGCFCSSCILEHDLSSVVECDAEMLTAEAGTPSA